MTEESSTLLWHFFWSWFKQSSVWFLNIQFNNNTDYNNTINNKTINREKDTQASCACDLFIHFFIVELCIERYTWYYNLQLDLHLCLSFLHWHRQGNACYCIDNAWIHVSFSLQMSFNLMWKN